MRILHSDGFVWFEFHEHPIIDYTQSPIKNFDITALGHVEFTSDFLQEDNFDHCQYCKCLIEQVLSLEENQLSAFLDYQCTLLKKPFSWLGQLDGLLDINCDHPFIYSYRNKLDLLIQLIEEKRNYHFSPPIHNSRLVFNWARQERFDIIKVKEKLNDKLDLDAKRYFLKRMKLDFLQEVDNNENARFVTNIDMELAFLESTTELQKNDTVNKKIIFRGSPSQLADLIFQLKELSNKDEQLLFEGSLSSFVQMFYQHVCKINGSDFNPSSIRRFLTKLNANQNLKETDRIDIDRIKKLLNKKRSQK